MTKRKELQKEYNKLEKNIEYNKAIKQRLTMEYEKSKYK